MSTFKCGHCGQTRELLLGAFDFSDVLCSCGMAMSEAVPFTPMPPDKTLEELATEYADGIFRSFDIDTTDANYKPYVSQSILEALQSATAAQQREVERLSEQLRTERERNLSMLNLLNVALYKLEHDTNTRTDVSVMIRSTLSHSGKEGV